MKENHCRQIRQGQVSGHHDKMTQTKGAVIQNNLAGFSVARVAFLYHISPNKNKSVSIKQLKNIGMSGQGLLYFCLIFSTMKIRLSGLKLKTI